MTNPEILQLSSRFIDEGVYEGPMAVNRMSTELSEVHSQIGFVEAFSNVVALETDDGLVLFDTSLDLFGPAVHNAIRKWTDKPISHICYTHGHVDHVGGAQVFIEDAERRGDPRPEVVSHEGVLPRFERYQQTNGYNLLVNQRQFSTLGGGLMGAANRGRFGPADWVKPTRTFQTSSALNAGTCEVLLHHSRGETDDHLWAWIPSKRAIITGDFVTWVLPNAGNPQKVQRYPREWAQALREMEAKQPELLLPAHGLPVTGTKRVSAVLLDTASLLEAIVVQTLALMNEGATLNACIHSVKVPPHLSDRPYLQPVYDEPEFIVNNVWRLYGGWYDGDPAHLKPPQHAALSSEIAAMCGGAQVVAKRAEALCETDLRMACQLIEYATGAAPDDGSIHRIRADIYQRRRDAEMSLMAKGIFGSTAKESERKIDM